MGAILVAAVVCGTLFLIASRATDTVPDSLLQLAESSSTDPHISSESSSADAGGVLLMLLN